jgi:hypothetical protein
LHLCFIYSVLNKDDLTEKAGEGFHEYLGKQIVGAQTDAMKRQHVFDCILRSSESCKPAKMAVTFFRKSELQQLNGKKEGSRL